MNFESCIWICSLNSDRMIVIKHLFCCAYSSTTAIKKKNAAVISDNFPYGRLLDWFVPVTLWNKHSSPWWPRAEPSDRNCTHNPPIYRIKERHQAVLFCWFVFRTNASLQDRLWGWGWQKGKQRFWNTGCHKFKIIYIKEDLFFRSFKGFAIK